VAVRREGPLGLRATVSRSPGGRQSPEERRAAEALADEALDGLEPELPRMVVEPLRRKMVQELLWTASGRERLVKVLPWARS
jgi:hypothetical protein